MAQAEVELSRDRGCGVAARRFVEQRTRDQLEPEELDDVKLVVTELVDNAYLHGEGRIWLRLDQRENSIRVEVIDQGAGAAVEVNRAPSAAGGYGLSIVDQLATAWGAYEGTTHVWAELPVGSR